jgi:hypothetical protein
MRSICCTESILIKGIAGVVTGTPSYLIVIGDDGFEGVHKPRDVLPLTIANLFCFWPLATCNNGSS